MFSFVWPKTLLSAFRYFERLTENIDSMIDKCAKGSFYVNSNNFMSNSTMVVADKIIALSERKVTLINCKLLVEEGLSLCKADAAEILIKKFIDGDKGKDIAAELNISMRSYFRKLDSSIHKFAQNIAKLGYNDSRLYDMLKNESWIMALHSRLLNKNEEDEILEMA